MDYLEERNRILDIEDEDEQKQAFEDFIKILANDDKYDGEIFEGYNCYYVISDAGLRAISNDASCSPKGGWFPEIVTGLPSEQTKHALEIAQKLNIDIDFFRKAKEDMCVDICDIDCKDFLEYYEEDNEEDLKNYKKLETMVVSGETKFEDMTQLIKAFLLNELDAGVVYYEWEGTWIDMYENILDFGDDIYELNEIAEWLELILEEDAYTL